MPLPQEAVGIIIYQFDNPVMVFRIGVTHSTALYHFSLAQRKLYSLYTIALAVMSR